MNLTKDSIITEPLYNLNEVCEVLEVSPYTLNNWYNWERKMCSSDKSYESKLPIPYKLTTKRGKPRMWDSKMIKQLKEFKEQLTIGRFGIYGKYTNPLHKEER